MCKTPNGVNNYGDRIHFDLEGDLRPYQNVVLNNGSFWKVAPDFQNDPDKMILVRDGAWCNIYTDTNSPFCIKEVYMPSRFNTDIMNHATRTECLIWKRKDFQAELEAEKIDLKKQIQHILESQTRLEQSYQNAKIKIQRKLSEANNKLNELSNQ